jgi:hypothetical protein
MPINWRQPLRGAKLTTLSGASALSGLAIPTPEVGSRIWSVPRQSGSIRLHLDQVWISRQQEIALVFNHGTVTMLVGRAAGNDPAAVFRRDLAAIKIGKARIGTVNGGSAFIAEPRTDYTKPNPALIEFYLGRLDLYVISTSLPTGMLLGVAKSVRVRSIPRTDPGN